MNLEVLCIEHLPQYVRDWLNKRGQAYPVKGQFYTAIDIFGETCNQYELAEFPPSDWGIGFGVLRNGWPIEFFVVCKHMDKEIREALTAKTPSRKLCRPIEHGMRHELDALQYFTVTPTGHNDWFIKIDPNNWLAYPTTTPYFNP